MLHGSEHVVNESERAQLVFTVGHAQSGQLCSSILLDWHGVGGHTIVLLPPVDCFLEPLISVREAQEALRNSLPHRLDHSLGLAKPSFDILRLFL